MSVPGGYDVEKVREDFPILGRTMAGDRPLVYLDSAASSQKPRQVIDAERHFYETSYANIHRGVYALSARATEAYDGARGRMAHREPQGLGSVRNVPLGGRISNNVIASQRVARMRAR